MANDIQALIKYYQLDETKKYAVIEYFDGHAQRIHGENLSPEEAVKTELRVGGKSWKVRYEIKEQWVADEIKKPALDFINAKYAENLAKKELAEAAAAEAINHLIKTMSKIECTDTSIPKELEDDMKFVDTKKFLNTSICEMSADIHDVPINVFEKIELPVKAKRGDGWTALYVKEFKKEGVFKITLFSQYVAL